MDGWENPPTWQDFKRNRYSEKTVAFKVLIAKGLDVAERVGFVPFESAFYQ